MSEAVPQRLGRYRILGELGRGAMGVVYKAHDEKLDRVVAVKTILVAQDADPSDGYLARFRQEARALGGLNHPSIIGVHEYGNEGEVAYMAMELLEGRELRDWIREGRMALPVAVEIAAQVAEGLAHAHAQGIVHRDIKPANIMIVAGPRAKIMDFGIARVRQSDVKTQTGLLLGSPKYMSPEQVMGRPLDARSDIFSLGVVLFEMLVGTPPFGGSDMHQLMFQTCNTRQPPPSQANREVPEMLDLIVAKALEKTPESRYADAQSLAKDLRACLGALAQGGGGDAMDATLVLEATQRMDAEVTRRVAPEAIRGGEPAGTQATVAATQATMAATLAMPGAQLLAPWRRFDSNRALERLARSEGDDRRRLSPELTPQRLWQRVRRDGPLQARVAAIGVAAVVALAIVAA